MTHPDYVREKARDLRARRKLTIDELAERLAVSRTTVYYWVRDLPIPRSVVQTPRQRLGTEAMQAKYRSSRAGHGAAGTGS
jgi:predicted site-specific integrase-resolvase